MLKIKNTYRNGKKNTFNRLSGSLGIAEERISELEDVTIETPKLNSKKQK